MAKRKHSRTHRTHHKRGRMGAIRGRAGGLIEPITVIAGAVLGGFVLKQMPTSTDKYKNWILIGGGLALKYFMKSPVVGNLGTGLAVAGTLKIAQEKGWIGAAQSPLIISRQGFPAERMNGFKVAPTIGQANPVNAFPRPSAIGAMNRRRYHAATS